MRRVLIAIILSIAVILTLLNSSSCYVLTGSKSLESFRYGALPTEASAGVLIADSQGFYARNGLRIEYRDYGSGPEAIQALLNNDVDIIGITEFPLVVAVLAKKPVSVFAIADRIEFAYLIARKDRGINKVADLKGKKIGLAQGSIAEFYLGRFLDLNGLSIQQVTIVNTRIPSISALVNGDVDAMITQQPYAGALTRQLADNAVTWEAQSNQLAFGIAVVRTDWIPQHRNFLERSLLALNQATDYIASHPVEVKTLLKNRFQYDDAYMDAVWSQHRFYVTLDQSLVLAMEDEARWLIQNNMTTEKTVPDFNDYIYEDALKAINPEAVNIRR